MKIKNRDREAIEYIIRYCNDIDSAVSRFGNSFESFSNEPIYRHACTMCILQIGEMSSHLSENLKSIIKRYRGAVLEEWGISQLTLPFPFSREVCCQNPQNPA